jgi:hypothetical protein
MSKLTLQVTLSVADSFSDKEPSAESQNSETGLVGISANDLILRCLSVRFPKPLGTMMTGLRVINLALY